MTEALEAHLRRQIEHSARFFWHRVRWSAVSIYLPKNKPFELLDIGAGAGVLGTFLAKDRPQATYHFVEPIETLREFPQGTTRQRRRCDRRVKVSVCAVCHAARCS